MRTVTKEEAEAIMSLGQNKNRKKGVFICYGVILVCSILMYMIYAGSGMTEQGIKWFLWMNAIAIPVFGTGLLWMSFRMKKISRLAELGRLYVREGIYEGKRGTSHFTIKEGSRWEYHGCNAAFMEEIDVGETVILLEFRGGATWVYKARK